MASKVDIANLALSHLGHGKSISNLETDRSDEANVCRLFYDLCRDSVLKDYKWPFLTKFAALALVEEDPTDEWAFSYRYPTDALEIKRILSGTRNDTRQSRVPYKMGQDNDGKLIYTDMEDAEIEYSAKADDPSKYPPDLVLALSFKLAVYIAPRIAAGDPNKLGARAMQMYEIELSKSLATAFNEEQAEELPDSEFIRSRE